VHKWRSEEAGIMVGTNTALYDNPELNVRKWSGHNPVRLVADISLRLPSSLNIYDQKQKTVIFNKIHHKEQGNVLYYQVTEDESLVQQVMNACYQLKIQSILVEGGALLLQSFIDEQAWDEARIITNNKLVIPNGLPAPQLRPYHIVSTKNVLSDIVHYCTPFNN
jgi:diaminohydroxyphosphoribosylaminopyrimidine deaminase/5-amino-6-(5-phosphoribosylamino)uracil reductase